MNDYEQDFPKMENNFLKASVFQDQDIPLTFKGWKKKANEDITKKDGTIIPRKSQVKYTLRYSYPEWALDENGEKALGKDGNPFKNRNFDPKYPHGYTIIYAFEEGTLNSGSLPLFNAFCMVRPKAGDVITIRREGEGQETKWTVKKVMQGSVHAQMKEKVIDVDEDFRMTPDEEVPF